MVANLSVGLAIVTMGTHYLFHFAYLFLKFNSFNGIVIK